MPRRRYKSPPIEEALCEFRFRPGRAWDLTVPGKLQAAIGDEYMGQPQEQRVVQLGLHIQQDKPSNLQMGEGLARVQLVSTNGKRMVGVGPDVLSVHMLRPYQDPKEPDLSGWDEFRARIETALGAYSQVAQPIGVTRVGIRYINKLVIPSTTVAVEEYLKCALPIVDGLPDHLTSFMSKVDYTYSDNVRMVLSQGSIEPASEHISLLLDLDVIWESQEAVDGDEVMTVVDDLRVRERVAFEAVITDKARGLFDAD